MDCEGRTNVALVSGAPAGTVVSVSDLAYPGQFGSSVTDASLLATPLIFTDLLPWPQLDVEEWNGDGQAGVVSVTTPLVFTFTQTDPGFSGLQLGPSRPV